MIVRSPKGKAIVLILLLCLLLSACGAAGKLDRNSVLMTVGSREVTTRELQYWLLPYKEYYEEQNNSSFWRTRTGKETERAVIEYVERYLMDRYTDDYLDFIKTVALKFRDTPYVAVEKRVDFSSWVPEGFGTADCILIGDDIMHVIDFKYGKGVPVSPVDNPQMQLYALGAFSMYGMLYDIKSIQMSIVQPRIDNIETWEASLDTVLGFGDWAKGVADQAIKGEGDFNPGESQCRFCRARAQCRARAEENVRMAFLTDKKPELLSNGEIGEYLLKGEDVARWLADLKEYALKESLAGREVAGWKAVEGRGSRTWTDGDAAFRKLIASGIDEAMLYERKPLTLAQTEKMVGKKEFTDLVGEYVEKKPGKPALVQISDKRPAITNAVTAAEAFGQ